MGSNRFDKVTRTRSGNLTPPGQAASTYTGGSRASVSFPCGFLSHLEAVEG
jgi:hypothetical protein